MRKFVLKAMMFLSFMGVFVLSLPAKAVEQNFDVQKAIAAGDHKGLAGYYKLQADEQRKVAEKHDKMKVAYKDSHVHYKGSDNVMQGHCSNLKDQALKAATQYDDLAKQEENLASKK